MPAGITPGLAGRRDGRRSPRGSRPAARGPPRKPWRDRRHAAGPRPAQPEAARPSEPNPPGEAEKPAAEPAREARRPSWRRDSPKGSRIDDGRARGADERRQDEAAPAAARTTQAERESRFAVREIARSQAVAEGARHHEIDEFAARRVSLGNAAMDDTDDGRTHESLAGGDRDAAIDRLGQAMVLLLGNSGM